MESEAGILDPPLLAKFHPLRRLLYSSGHEPLHQCSRTGPEVTSTIPEVSPSACGFLHDNFG